MEKCGKVIMGICCLVAFATALQRCTKGDPISQPLVSCVSAAADSSTVYMAGTESKSDKSGRNTNYAVYWRNGHQVTLTDSSNNAFAYAIAVSGTDVYVAGSVAPHAKYWKNGFPVTLSESISTALAIAISGSDVYIAGNVFEDGRVLAVYWKNGIRVTLSK